MEFVAGQSVLLTLDCAMSRATIRSPNGANVVAAMRVTLPMLNKASYTVVRIGGLMASAAEQNYSKIFNETFVV